MQMSETDPYAAYKAALSEHGHYCACVGLVYELLYGIALKGLNEGCGLVSGLIAGPYSDPIAVGHRCL